MRRRLILLPALLLLGCGEAERPRFTPSPGPSAVPAEPRSPGKASREVAVPRNIETH